MLQSWFHVAFHEVFGRPTPDQLLRQLGILAMLEGAPNRFIREFFLKSFKKDISELYETGAMVANNNGKKLVRQETEYDTIATFSTDIIARMLEMKRQIRDVFPSHKRNQKKRPVRYVQAQIRELANEIEEFTDSFYTSSITEFGNGKHPARAAAHMINNLLCEARLTLRAMPSFITGGQATDIRALREDVLALFNVKSAMTAVRQALNGRNRQYDFKLTNPLLPSVRKRLNSVIAPGGSRALDWNRRRDSFNALAGHVDRLVTGIEFQQAVIEKNLADE